MLTLRCLTRPSISCIAQHSRWMSSADGPQNKAILSMLQESVRDEKAKADSDRYRVRAYQSATRIVEAAKLPLASAEDVKKLKGLSPNVRQRIAAFVKGEDWQNTPKSWTAGRKKVHDDPAMESVIQELRTIPGVGRTLALKLVDSGCRGIHNMHMPEYQEMLGPAKAKTLNYLKYLTLHSTREQALEVLDFVKQGLPSTWEVHLVGDHRRGAHSAPVIKLLLLHHTYVHVPTPLITAGIRSVFKNDTRQKFATPLSSAVIDPLTRQALVANTIRLGSNRWHGMVRIPRRTSEQEWEDEWIRLQAVARRSGDYRPAEFYLAPMKSRGAALMFLTGDASFLRHVRAESSKLGLFFNEYGLWRFHPRDDAPEQAESETTERPGHWEMLPSATEEQIMDEVCMPYIEPERRNFSPIFEDPWTSDRRQKKLAVASA